MGVLGKTENNAVENPIMAFEVHEEHSWSLSRSVDYRHRVANTQEWLTHILNCPAHISELLFVYFRALEFQEQLL